MIRSSIGLGGVVLAAFASAIFFACSSSTADTPATTDQTQSTLAAVPGEPDMHCGTKVVKVDPAACNAAVDAGVDTNDFGDTMSGSSGNDDDCKYHLSWTSSPVSENTNITFVVTVTNLIDGTPVTGATPYIEAFLDERTPAPNSNSATTESPPGVYAIGPILFNAPGHWTVRFHIAPNCHDTDDSPHGHGAFFVGVP